MTKNFASELSELQSLIKEYQSTLNLLKIRTPEQLAYFNQLKVIYQKISAAIKNSVFDNCPVRGFGILEPYGNSSYLK